MSTQDRRNTSLQSSIGNKKSREVIKFEPGCRLEAQDFDGRWYSAKVQEVDWVDRIVKVHFDNWNTKFDEWVQMDSGRLRSVEQPPPRQAKTFARGDRVLAMWSAYQKYPATVQRVLPDGKYEVLFEDGFIKCLPGSRVWKLDAIEKSKPVTTVNTNIGSKQDRRDRKRKFNVNVVDLLRPTKRPASKRTSDVGSAAATSSASSRPPKPSTDSKAASPIVRSGSSTNAVGSAGAMSPQGQLVRTDSKDVLSTSADTSAQGQIDASENKVAVTTMSPGSPGGFAHCELGPPVEMEVEYLDGRKETWTKVLQRRMEGKTAGRLDIVICSGQGKKFRSRNEIMKHCEENKIRYKPSIFDFSARGHPRFQHAVVSSLPSSVTVEPEPLEPTPPPPPPQETSPLVVKDETDESIVSPLPQPTPVIEDVGEEESKKLIGKLEIVVEDGQFICPVEVCRKHFRRENLVHMHMKHYHPDLSKYLEHTPSVTDLAYARTASSDCSPDLASPSPKSLNRRSFEPKKPHWNNCRVQLKKMEMIEPAIQSAPSPTPEIKVEEADTVAFLKEEPPEEKVVPKMEEEHAPVTGLRHIRRPVKHPVASLQRTDCVAEIKEEPKDEGGDLVQRNPILNTLLSARPTAVAPSMRWRPYWRRGRRYSRHRRQYRPPAPLPPSRPTKPPVAVESAENVDVLDSSIPSTAHDADKVEQLRRHEIINCVCQMKEEDGLMIQCEVCLCWQHGHCLGISRQSSVPHSYICAVCKNPPKGRTSHRYRNHQQWIKEGVLPSLSYSKKDPETLSRRQALLKRSFDLSGQLSQLTRLLCSLRTKVSIVRHKDHPKLWMWAHKESDNSAQIKTSDPGTPKIPEPEKAIDPAECKMNLLSNIERYQSIVEARISTLDAQLAELETLDKLMVDNDEPDSYPRTKETVVMLLRDLDTVKKVTQMP